MSTCVSPLPFETLVDYWSRALSEDATAAAEEHLFGCAACTDRSGQVAALIRSFGKMLPPIISPRRLDELQAAGVRLRHTPVDPGAPTTAVFSAGVDMLIHHLRVPVADARRVDCQVFGTDGQMITDFPHAPFDRERGEVIIACQRHYMAHGLDTYFKVTTIDQAGASQVREYTVHHLLEG